MDVLGSMKDRILEQQTALTSTLVKQIKTETTRTEFTPAIRDWVVDNLGVQDMQMLIQEFGQDAVERMLYERYKPDKRRQ